MTLAFWLTNKSLNIVAYMNRRLIIAIIAVVLVLVVVGYLYTQGYFQNFKWQTGTMVLAALAAPYQIVMNWIKGGEDEKILKKHEAIREDEKKHRIDYDAQIDAKKKQIEDLDKKINEINVKVTQVEEKRATVEQKVNTMSNAELQQKGKDLFGS